MYLPSSHSTDVFIHVNTHLLVSSTPLSNVLSISLFPSLHPSISLHQLFLFHIALLCPPALPLLISPAYISLFNHCLFTPPSSHLLLEQLHRSGIENLEKPRNGLHPGVAPSALHYRLAWCVSQTLHQGLTSERTGSALPAQEAWLHLIRITDPASSRPAADRRKS